MSDEHITVELKFIDHSWKQANIRCSFCWAQTSWTWLASTHEVDLDAAIDRLSWSAESDIHGSAEDEKYQSQIKIYKVRFGWFEGGLTCLISHIFLYEYGKKNRVALSACGLPRTIWTRTTCCTAMFLTGWVKNSQKIHAKLCRVNQI